MQKTTLLTTLILVALTGCKDEPERSVEYYIENDVEREAMLKKCGELSVSDWEASANCSQAETANLKVQQQKSHENIQKYFGNSD